jgi:hypothetical protein
MGVLLCGINQPQALTEEATIIQVALRRLTARRLPGTSHERRTADTASRVICVFAITALACDDSDRPRAAEDTTGATLYAAGGEPCSIVTRAFASDTVTITDAGAPPCRLLLRATGISLRGTLDGSVPYPGRSVARDSHGRFVSSVSGDGTRFAVWHPDGSFITTVGRHGSGPGEFPGGPELVVFTDASDNIHVRESGGRWSVFDASLGYLTSFRSEGVGTQSSQFSQVLADGRVAESGTASGAPYVSITDAGGRSRRLDVSPAVIEIVDPQYATNRRAIHATRAASLWVGPWRAAPSVRTGYALEHWSAAGNLLMTLVRHPAWYPGPAPGTAARQGQIVPSPLIVPVNIDPDGYLLVYAWVANRDWRWIDDDDERGRSTPAFQNLHLEVLDPATGTVVASEAVRVSAIVNGVMPRYFFPGTRLGYYLANPDSAEPSIEVVEYTLVRRYSQ